MATPAFKFTPLSEVPPEVSPASGVKFTPLEEPAVSPTLSQENPTSSAPPVHTDSGFGPPQVFQGVKSAAPVAAAQGAFADYNSRWKPAVPVPPQPVAGMEKLGGTPPGPPAVEKPADLDPDRTTPSVFQNPRTGKIGTDVTPGRSNPVANAMDSFVTGPAEMKQGVEQMAEGNARDIAGGASHVLRGGMQTATPLVVAAGAVAPISTVATVATGSALQAGSEKVLKAAGVPEEYAALGADIVGLFGAGAAYKRLQGLSKLSLVAEGNGIAERLTAAVERAKNTTLTAMERAAARAQVDSLTQGLRRVESGEPSTGAPLPPVVPGAAAAEAPPVELSDAEKLTANRKRIRAVQAQLRRRAAKAGAGEGEVAPEVAPVATPEPIEPGSVAPTVAPVVTPEAPPAITPEAVPMPEQAAPPLEQSTAATERAQAGPTFGSGLGALQPHYDAAVATLKGDVESTRALIAKRDMALEALKKSATTPAEKDAGQKILQYYTGERDVWGAKMNQTLESLRKVVPDHAEQEGLSLMRDFKSRPGELQAWLDGSHPTLSRLTGDALATAKERIEQMRPAIEKALNPTPGMMAADQVLTTISELSLLEGRKRGFLESRISSDEYVSHLLHPPEMAEFRPLSEKAGSLMGGKIGRRFAFAQTRQYPTLLDAVADNQKPRTLNALTAFTIHADKFATSRATAMLVEQLRKTGVGKWAVGTSKVPDGWVEIAPHAHPFQNTVNVLSQSGDPTSMPQRLYVPKFVEQAMRPITDPDFSNKIIGFMPMRNWQAWTKSIQLGMSFFHATAMNYMAAANMGAKGLAKGWMADRDSQAFLDGERRFIAHGGTTSIQGKTFEAYRSLEPGSIPGWGDIMQRAPGIRQADQVANKITELTFGKLQRQFKVTDFSLKEAAWLAENPTASAAQRATALQSIAKEINGVYGGLHWENIGVNKMSLNAARMIMLAPDWTFSNFANAKYATEKSPAGQASRMFWARQAVGGLVATQAMSLLLSQKTSPRPFQVYMGKDKDGQDIYQNMFFKGASGDLINLITQWKDRGLVEGTARTAIGKVAPGLRTGFQAAFNTTYTGQPIVPKGTDFLPATLRGAGMAALDMSPIPLSGANLVRMATGPNADRTTLPEFLTTPFVGVPPSHVPPAGMRMTDKGLKPAPEKPQKPFMDQLLNRKGPPRVRLGR